MFKWLNKLSKKHWLIILMIASVFLSAFGKAAAEPMRGLAHWLLALGQPGMGLTASIKSRLHGGADGGLSSFEASDLKKKLEEATWRCEKAEADLLKRMDEEKTRVKVCGSVTGAVCAARGNDSGRPRIWCHATTPPPSAMTSPIRTKCPGGVVKKSVLKLKKS